MNSKFYHLALDEIQAIVVLAPPFDWSCFWRTTTIRMHVSNRCTHVK